MRTREKIIQASIELFNEHGERQITTNHIAAHLGISPGNLYYHFRNKNDIIHHIFCEYKQQLEDLFSPRGQSLNTIKLLQHYFDGVFELMWRFNFLYSNLPDILSRDVKLHTLYLELQARQVEQMIDAVTELKRSGVLNIPTEDIADFIHGIKVTVTFWISYLKIQPVAKDLSQGEVGLLSKIEKPMLYKGVLTVLLMLKPYLSGENKQAIEALQQHYSELAQGA